MTAKHVPLPHLCLTKYNVRIRGRAFVHVRFCNNEENVLGLSYRDSSNPSITAQPKFHHGLSQIKRGRVNKKDTFKSKISTTLLNNAKHSLSLLHNIIV